VVAILGSRGKERGALNLQTSRSQALAAIVHALQRLESDLNHPIVCGAIQLSWPEPTVVVAVTPTQPLSHGERIDIELQPSGEVLVRSISRGQFAPFFDRRANRRNVRRILSYAAEHAAEGRKLPEHPYR
jgi:hypothetical protein